MVVCTHKKSPLKEVSVVFRKRGTPHKVYDARGEKMTRMQELQEVCKPVIDYIEQHSNEISEVIISRNRITASQEVMVAIVPEEIIREHKYK